MYNFILDSTDILNFWQLRTGGKIFLSEMKAMKAVRYTQKGESSANIGNIKAIVSLLTVTFPISFEQTFYELVKLWIDFRKSQSTSFTFTDFHPVKKTKKKQLYFRTILVLSRICNSNKSSLLVTPLPLFCFVFVLKSQNSCILCPF